MGAAGIATGLLYQKQMGRSFLPFMKKPKVSRGAAEAGECIVRRKARRTAPTAGTR